MTTNPSASKTGTRKPTTMAKKQPNISSEDKSAFGKVVDRFVLEIDSLVTTLPYTVDSIFEAHKGVFEELDRFLSTHGKKKGGKKTVLITADLYTEFQKLRHDLDSVNAAFALVPRSFLVALVSQYDNFLGLLIQAVFLAKPEILSGSEKALSFAELVRFGSIEAARESIIESEVEAILRESHAKQFDWLERKLKIPLRNGLSVWPIFVEVTERRNLFVHTGGQVSAQYLSVCKSHACDFGKTAKGDVLTVTSDYFRKAHAAIFEVGVKLAHVLWRKLKPEERESADVNLLLISYNLLAEEKYDLAITILDFAVNVLKKHVSADIRIRFVVNLAQAYKWSGNNDRAAEILDQEDFSALNDVFKLANVVLRNDYKQAIELVKAIGAHGDIGLNDYREWPLFLEFRKFDGLNSVIQDVFGEPLNQIKVGSGALTSPDSLDSGNVSTTRAGIPLLNSEESL